MTRVNFTLTEWDKAMLEELAAHYGTSNSDMIRRLIMMAHQRIAQDAPAQPKAEAQAQTAA